MLKQLTVENIFNFKEEITTDFITTAKKDECFHIFDKDKISNFSIFYGKNNVGKSNLLRIMSYVKDFILDGQMKLEPYRPEENREKGSIFEIILEDDNHEIRYGFELLISKVKVKDEWMYAKLNNSTRESLIFSRSLLKMHSTFLKSELNTFKNMKDDRLFINYFTNITHKHDVIDSFIKMIERIHFLDCVYDITSPPFKQSLIRFANDNNKLKLFNTFLMSADLDLKEVDIKEFSEDENLVMEKFLSLMESDEEQKTKEKKLNDLIGKNLNLIRSIIGKEWFKTGYGNDSANDSKYAAISFVHQNGASFKSHELSTGTRQIVNLLSTIVDNFEQPSIYLFDEIETGLHLDLIILIMNLFKYTLKVIPENQFIITTHREETLDFDYIPNDNKMLLKYDDKKKSPYNEYISEYRLREYHKLSDRYKLDAFDSNPNTSYEYLLYEIIKEIVDERKDNESKTEAI